MQRLWSLYEQGASDVEVCADLKLPWREFEKRLRNDDNFALLVEAGRLAAKAWWEGIARKNIKDKSFQFSIWFANMKNRYGWTDKVDLNSTTKDNDQLSKEELEQKLTDTFRKKRGKITSLMAIKNVEVEDESGQVH